MPVDATWSNRMQENFQTYELTAFLQAFHKCYFHSRSFRLYCPPVWPSTHKTPRFAIAPVLYAGPLLCTYTNYWRTCTRDERECLFQSHSLPFPMVHSHSHSRSHVRVSIETSLPRSQATPTRRQPAAGPVAERVSAVSVDALVAHLKSATERQTTRTLA